MFSHLNACLVSFTVWVEGAWHDMFGQTEEDVDVVRDLHFLRRKATVQVCATIDGQVWIDFFDGRRRFIGKVHQEIDVGLSRPVEFEAFRAKTEEVGVAWFKTHSMKTGLRFCDVLQSFEHDAPCIRIRKALVGVAWAECDDSIAICIHHEIFRMLLVIQFGGEGGVQNVNPIWIVQMVVVHVVADVAKIPLLAARHQRIVIAVEHCLIMWLRLAVDRRQFCDRRLRQFLATRSVECAAESHSQIVEKRRADIIFLTAIQRDTFTVYLQTPSSFKTLVAHCRKGSWSWCDRFHRFDGQCHAGQFP